MPQAAYRAHKAHPRVLIMTFDNGVQEKVPLEQHVANYATSKFCLAPAGRAKGREVGGDLQSYVR